MSAAALVLNSDRLLKVAGDATLYEAIPELKPMMTMVISGNKVKLPKTSCSKCASRKRQQRYSVLANSLALYLKGLVDGGKHDVLKRFKKHLKADSVIIYPRIKNRVYPVHL